MGMVEVSVASDRRLNGWCSLKHLICAGDFLTIYFDSRSDSSAKIGAVIVKAPRKLGVVARPSIARVLYRIGLKRALDVTLILIAAPIVVVTVGILAVLVTLQGGSPFYAQDRVGRHGRVFRMWKLRTMVVDAEKKLDPHLAANPQARQEWDRTQKLKDDPRITRFGGVLRKCSLDELPQLWNVLVGDMSLVGPRPMMPCQQALYPGQVYYKLRPGITGLWQVSARNESTFAEREHFDVEYEQSVSLATDLGLLAKTVRVVVRATGY